MGFRSSKSSEDLNNDQFNFNVKFHPRAPPVQPDPVPSARKLIQLSSNIMLSRHHPVPSGVDPGNSPLSRLGSQSSASSDASRSGLSLKKGRNMRYAVESLRNGTTRRVPSVALVVESEVQPCQARKTVHWLLLDGECLRTH